MKLSKFFVLTLASLAASSAWAATCIGDRYEPLCVGDVVRHPSVQAIGRVSSIDDIYQVAIVQWGHLGVGSGIGRVRPSDLFQAVDRARNGVFRGGIVELTMNGCRGRAAEVFQDGSAYVEWASPCTGRGLKEEHEIRAIGSNPPPPPNPPVREFRVIQRDRSGRSHNVAVRPVGPNDSSAIVRVIPGDLLLITDANGRRLSLRIE